MESAAHRVFALYNYREIRTPIFEDTGLFVRSIGETTDIVGKEMYSFDDGGGNSLTLRPEATAPVVRAYAEHALHTKRGFWKLYYIGPMFRKERPQAGRRRQFHQIGVEAMGSGDPLLDVEVIRLADVLLGALGVSGHRVRLNSTGCPACRPGYRDLLRERLAPHREKLCGNCRGRMERNVFRVLDCKVEGCRAVCTDLPGVLEHLCEGCAAHHAGVREGLGALKTAFVEDKTLVRGLDYYTQTVFEFTHDALGAQDAVGGGGRYNDLLGSFGAPPAGAVGFSIGMERVVMAATAPAEAPASLDAYVVAVTPELRGEAFALVERLREAGLGADLDYEGKRVKGQMKNANRAAARCAVILGPDEMAAGAVKVRRMDSGEEADVPLADVVPALRAKLGKER
jgi:histidyl-tRNA synthetase